MDKKRDLFVRDASGLVREVSTLNALAFNISAETGGAGSVAINYMVFAAPAVMLFGLPAHGWGAIILGLFCVVYCLIFVALTSAMPRTGGDYVYSSRIMHPFLGWIEAWTFLWSLLPLVGFCAWQGIFGIYVQAATNAVIYPNSVWTSIAAAMQPQLNMLIISTIALVIISIMVTLPTRTYHKILTAGSLLCMTALGIMLFASFFADPNIFAANFQKYTGQSTEQVIQSAIANGWHRGEFNLGTLGPLLAFMMLLFIGFVYSAFMAGELKGNVQRNTVIASLGAVLWIVCIQAFFLLPWVRIAGLDTIYAWSYLYWNGYSAPLGAPAYANSLLQLAMPQLSAPLTVLGILVGGVFCLLLVPVWATTSIRMFFAFAMDRMTPKRWAKVDERTHSPIYLNIIVMVISWFMLYETIYGVSPINTSWFTVCCSVLVWIFPGLNAVLIPYRRKDLYELVPATWKKNIAGVPIIVVLGVIWLAFAVPIYVAEFMLPMATQIISGGAAVLTSVTGGISMTIAVVVVGIVWYLVAYNYNKRKGVDVSLLYRTIPPE